MDLYTLALLALIVVLLVLSAMFSGSETAFTAASQAFIARRSKEGSHNAGRLSFLRERKDRFIAALLVGNNFVNTTATALASGLLITWFGEEGVLYASLVMTVVLVIFAEVLPKTYALQRPDETALKAAPFLSLTMMLLGPLGSAVNWILGYLMRAVGVEPAITRPGQDAEELQGLIDLYGSEETGAAQSAAREERQMLRGVLSLDDMTVADVMTQRMRIVGLDATLPAEEIVHRLLKADHSRLVLWGETQDDVVGIIDARTVLRAVEQAGGQMEAMDLAATAVRPVFIPESRPLREQLDSFRTAPQKIALVVDEHGGLSGLVSLEDIVEVVFGQIAQRGEAIISDPEDRGLVIVRGDTRIRDLNRALEWSLPEGEAATVGGLLVTSRGGLPDPGTQIDLDDYRFTILERHGWRIDSVEVRRRVPAEPQGGPAAES